MASKTVTGSGTIVLIGATSIAYGHGPTVLSAPSWQLQRFEVKPRPEQTS